MCVCYLILCVWQMYNSVCVMFANHSPEICHCAAKGSLAHDELLTVVMSLKTPACVLFIFYK